MKITIIDTYYTTLKMFLSIDIHGLSLTMDYFFMRLQRTSFFSTTWNCNHEVLNLSSLSFWNLHLNLLIFNKTLIFCRKNVIDYLSNSYFDRTFHYLECKLLQLGKGGDELQYIQCIHIWYKFHLHILLLRSVVKSSVSKMFFDVRLPL